MLKSNDRILYYTALYTLAALVVICGLYVFRKDLFYRKNLSEQRALQEGYGFYETPVSLGCITENNLCSEDGTETFVSRCVPNPQTSNGCFNEDNGTMTFDSIITTKSCTKQCIKYAFSVQNGILHGTEDQATSTPATIPPKEPTNAVKQVYNQGCNRVIDPYYGIDYTNTYFGTYNPSTQKYDMNYTPDTNYPICIPSKLTGFIQKKYVCSNNDQNGLKLCQYMCGTETTLGVSGKFESNTTSENVLMHYPYYDQGDGQKFYFCYNQIGDNLLEGLYNTETVGPDFVFPKECYTKYISNFKKYGITDTDITYLSNYITIPDSNFVTDSTSFDISQTSALTLPNSYQQQGPVLEFEITNPGQGYEIGDKFNFGIGDAYIIVDGGLGANGELSTDIGYYTFYGGTLNDTYTTNQEVSLYVTSAGNGGTIIIRNVTGGVITEYEISSIGSGYSKGDILYISGGNGDARLTITGNVGKNGELPLSTGSYTLTGGSEYLVSDYTGDINIPYSSTNDTDTFLAQSRFIGLSQSGEQIIIGNLETSGGSFEVYNFESNTITQLGNTITQSSLNNGVSVAINKTGNYVAVSGITEVFVYQYNQVEWIQVGESIPQPSELGSPTYIFIDISDDGTTIAFGLTNIYSYSYNGSSWTQKGSTITETESVTNFGQSISMSGNGNTIAIGSKDNIYIYNYTTSWAQITGSPQPITTTSANNIGYVSLTSDGTTVVTGTAQTPGGSFSVFTIGSSDITQKGSTITSTVANFGSSVSISDDGNTVAVGSNGSVYLYYYTTEWNQIFTKSETANNYGYLVSLSGDGTTLGTVGGTEFYGYNIEPNQLTERSHKSIAKATITKVDDNGSIMLAKVGVEFMKVITLNKNQSTITSLSEDYYLYSKNEISSLTVIPGKSSGSFEYVYKLSSSNYNQIIAPATPSSNDYVFYDGNCNVLKIKPVDSDLVPEPSLQKIGSYNGDKYYKLTISDLSSSITDRSDVFITKSLIINQDLSKLQDISNISYQGDYNAEFSFVMSRFITETTASIIAPYTVQINFGGIIPPTVISTSSNITLKSSPFNKDFLITGANITPGQTIVYVDRDFLQDNNIRVPHNSGERVYFLHNFAEKLADFTELMSPYILNSDGSIQNGCFDEFNKARPHGYVLNLEPGQTVVANIQSVDYNLDVPATVNNLPIDSPICGVYGYIDDVTNVPKPPYQSRKGYGEINVIQNQLECSIPNIDTTNNISNMFKLGISNTSSINQLSCFSGYEKGATNRICEIPQEPTEFDIEQTYNTGDIVYQQLNNSQFYISVVDNNTFELSNSTKWKEVSFLNSTIQNMSKGEYFINKKPNVLRAIDAGTDDYSWDVYNVQNSGLRTVDPSNYFTPYVNSNAYFPPKLVDIKLELTTDLVNNKYYPFNSQNPVITQPFYMDLLINKLVYAPTDVTVNNGELQFSNKSANTWRKYTYGVEDFDFINPALNSISDNAFYKAGVRVSPQGNTSNWNYGLRFDTRPDIIYNNSKLTISGTTDNTENQIDLMGLRSKLIPGNTTHEYTGAFIPKFVQSSISSSTSISDLNNSIIDHLPQWDQTTANQAYGSKFGIYTPSYPNVLDDISSISKANLMNWNIINNDNNDSVSPTIQSSTGSGYTSGSVTIKQTTNDTSNSTATATITTRAIVKILKTDGGSGYNTTDPVTITQGTNTTATASITLNNGAIENITIIDGGSGYNTTDAVTITQTVNDVPNNSATANITQVSTSIKSITITDGGLIGSYVSTEPVTIIQTIDGITNNSATASIIEINGVIKRISFLDFSLVPATETNVGAEEFASRWYKNLTNALRIFFWPLYSPESNSVEYSKSPQSRSFSSNLDNNTDITAMLSNAKAGTKYTFNIPNTYNQYFKLASSSADEITTLANYEYTLPVVDSTSYTHETTLDIFVHHSYTVNSNTWWGTLPSNIQTWLNTYYSNTIDMVPLFASISLRDDVKNMSKIDPKYYALAYDDDTMSGIQLSSTSKPPAPTTTTPTVDSLQAFDYFEAFNSIYAKDLEISDKTSDSNQLKKLWGSYSVNQGEFVIARYDEASDADPDAYRLVMLQKNEDFSNLELYFNYPRAPAIFSIPEIEPLSVGPEKYSKIYCYINNIESIFPDIKNITITGGGSGYSSGPVTITQTINGVTNSTATAIITASSGAIQSIIVTSNGSGYNSTKPVTITQTTNGTPNSTATGSISFGTGFIQKGKGVMWDYGEFTDNNRQALSNLYVGNGDFSQTYNEYWNEQYLPFNQSTMQTGYSRLAKSIPGKLAYDGWGTRSGNGTYSSSDSIGKYVVNVFLYGLHYNNKLMPVYKAQESSAQVWWTSIDDTDTTSDTTPDDIDNFVHDSSTTSWGIVNQDSGDISYGNDNNISYKKIYQLPTSTTVRTNSAEWQTYLDNVWTPPGIVYQKNIEYINVPDYLNPTATSTTQPSPTSLDSDLVAYESIPFYWLNNMHYLYDSKLGNQSISNNIFYNDFVRSVFWGNGQTTNNTLMQPYSSDTLFTTYQEDIILGKNLGQVSVAPSFSSESFNYESINYAPYTIGDGQYTKTGNTFLPTIQNYIYQDLVNGVTYYNPLDFMGGSMGIYNESGNKVTLPNPYTITSPSQSLSTISFSSTDESSINTFRTLEQFTKNLYSVLWDDINAFFPIPLISSYCDVNDNVDVNLSSPDKTVDKVIVDLNNPITDNNQAVIYKSYGSSTSYTNNTSELYSGGEFNKFDQQMCYQQYCNSLGSYFYNTMCTLVNLPQSTENNVDYGFGVEQQQNVANVGQGMVIPYLPITGKDNSPVMATNNSAYLNADNHYKWVSAWNIPRQFDAETWYSQNILTGDNAAPTDTAPHYGFNNFYADISIINKSAVYPKVWLAMFHAGFLLDGSKWLKYGAGAGGNSYNWTLALFNRYAPKKNSVYNSNDTGPIPPYIENNISVLVERQNESFLYDLTVGYNQDSKSNLNLNNDDFSKTCWIELNNEAERAVPINYFWLPFQVDYSQYDTDYPFLVRNAQVFNFYTENSVNSDIQNFLNYRYNYPYPASSKVQGPLYSGLNDYPKGGDHTAALPLMSDSRYNKSFNNFLLSNVYGGATRLNNDTGIYQNSKPGLTSEFTVPKQNQILMMMHLIGLFHTLHNQNAMPFSLQDSTPSSGSSYGINTEVPPSYDYQSYIIQNLYPSNMMSGKYGYYSNPNFVMIKETIDSKDYIPAYITNIKGSTANIKGYANIDGRSVSLSGNLYAIQGPYNSLCKGSSDDNNNNTINLTDFGNITGFNDGRDQSLLNEIPKPIRVMLGLSGYPGFDYQTPGAGTYYDIVNPTTTVNNMNSFFENLVTYGNEPNRVNLLAITNPDIFFGNTYSTQQPSGGNFQNSSGPQNIYETLNTYMSQNNRESSNNLVNQQAGGSPYSNSLVIQIDPPVNYFPAGWGWPTFKNYSNTAYTESTRLMFRTGYNLNNNGLDISHNVSIPLMPTRSQMINEIAFPMSESCIQVADGMYTDAIKNHYFLRADANTPNLYDSDFSSSFPNLSTLINQNDTKTKNLSKIYDAVKTHTSIQLNGQTNPTPNDALAMWVNPFYTSTKPEATSVNIVIDEGTIQMSTRGVLTCNNVETTNNYVIQPVSYNTGLTDLDWNSINNTFDDSSVVNYTGFLIVNDASYFGKPLFIYDQSNGTPTLGNYNIADENNTKLKFYKSDSIVTSTKNQYIQDQYNLYSKNVVDNITSENYSYTPITSSPVKNNIATATVTLTGAIGGITLINGGYGYTSGSVEITQGNNTTASAKITTNNGIIQPITPTNITNVGSGYDYTKPVTITQTIGGLSNSSAAAIITDKGAISNLTLSKGGNGYTTSLGQAYGTIKVSMVQGINTTAEADATISNGIIQSVNFLPYGSGYNTTDPVTIKQGTNNSATATITASSTGAIQNISITPNGNGYSTGPVSIIQTGSDNNATATITASSSGSITGIKLRSNRGIDYDTTRKVSLVPKYTSTTNKFPNPNNNLLLKFPIKEFYQVQSPWWRMRAENYCPVDGAATTIIGTANSQYQWPGQPSLQRNVNSNFMSRNKATRRVNFNRVESQYNWNYTELSDVDDVFVQDNNSNDTMVGNSTFENLGMPISGGHAEKYTFTKLDSSTNYIPYSYDVETEISNSITTTEVGIEPMNKNVLESANFYISQYATQYAIQSPQYLPYVYDKRFIDVLPLNYSIKQSDMLVDQTSNYNEMFKMLQSYNSGGQTYLNQNYNQITDVITVSNTYNKSEITFKDDSFNFYQTDDSIATDFLYEPIIVSNNQDPYIWSTSSSQSPPIQYGLVKTGQSNKTSDNRTLFGSSPIDVANNYTTLNSWYDGSVLDIAEPFDSRTHTKFVSLYVIEEDTQGKFAEAVFGPTGTTTNEIYENFDESITNFVSESSTPPSFSSPQTYGSNTTATGTINANDGVIESITISPNGSGSGYSSDTVTIRQSGSDNNATANINVNGNGSIQNIAISPNGSGYDSTKPVTIAQGGNTQNIKFRYNNQNTLTYPFYNATQGLSYYTDTINNTITDTINNTNITDYTYETTVPPSSSNSYKFYNLGVRVYQSSTINEDTISNFFNHVYGSNFIQASNLTTTPTTTPTTNLYTNLNNLTGRTFVKNNKNPQTPRTAYVNPNYQFNMPIVNLKDNFNNNAVISPSSSYTGTPSLAGVTTLAYNYGYGQQNPELRWQQNGITVYRGQSITNSNGFVINSNGFVPTESPIIKSIYNDPISLNRNRFGAGWQEGNWLGHQLDSTNYKGLGEENHGTLNYFYRDFYTAYNVIITQPGSDNNATATITVNSSNAITDIKLTNGGSGYSSSNVTITQIGNDNSATTTITVTDGVIESIVVPSSSSGYSSNNEYKLPPNLGITNNYLYQKYDEQLSMTSTTNDPFHDRFSSLFPEATEYFSTYLNDSNGESSVTLSQNTEATTGTNYKIIAVTDILDAGPYLFEGTNLNQDSDSDVKPIWHRINPDGETIDFKTLLFYKSPSVDKNDVNSSTMGRSNFFIDKAGNDKMLRCKVDATDAWSSVNDLTPYQQPSQLYDQLLPGYGCLPMSGGRMVWNELNYDSGGNRVAEDSTVSIEDRAYNYLNNVVLSNTPGPISNYKCTSYSLTSNLEDSSRKPRTLNDNSIYYTLTGGNDVNLKTITFEYDSTSTTSAMNVNVVITVGTQGLHETFTISTDGITPISSTSLDGTITFGALRGILTNTATNTGTVITIKTKSNPESLLTITLNNTGSSSPFLLLTADSQAITLLDSETIYAVLPMLSGLNSKILKGLTITGYFPQISQQQGYGLYVSQDFFNQFLANILPGEGTYLNTIFDPFKLTIGSTSFTKSNNFTQNPDGTGSFKFDFYTSNTPNTLSKTNANETASLSRDEFYVKPPSTFNAALGFKSSNGLNPLLNSNFTISGGSGYSVTPTSVTLTSTTGTGSGAEATIVSVSSGAIKTFTITNPGSGYAIGDVLTFPGGTNGTITVKLIANLTTGGSGYSVSTTAVTLTGGSGSGAEATINSTSTSGAIESFKITNNGSGYVVGDVLTFSSSTGGTITVQSGGILTSSESYIKPQTLITPQSLINGLYVLPVSTQTVFTKIGGIRYFFKQTYNLTSATSDTSATVTGNTNGSMTYTQLSTSRYNFNKPSPTDQSTIVSQSTSEVISNRIPSNVFLSITSVGSGYTPTTTPISLFSGIQDSGIKANILSIVAFEINITKVSNTGKIISWDIMKTTTGNTGYAVGETLKILGGDENAILTIQSVGTNGALSEEISDYILNTSNTGYAITSTPIRVILDSSNSNATGGIYQYEITDYGSDPLTLTSGTTLTFNQGNDDATATLKYPMSQLLDVSTEINFLHLYGLPSTASGSNQDNIQIALNDIKNFISKLNEGDIIGIEQELIDQIDPFRIHPIYTFSVTSTDPSKYIVRVETIVTTDEGKEQSLNIDKIAIESPFTYVYLYSTTLSANGNDRKGIMVSRMSFIEGIVKYDDLTDPSKYQDYTIVTPAYLKTFDIVQGSSLVEESGQSLYNQNFNLTFYTSFEQPAQLFDVFGSFSSNTEGSTIANPYLVTDSYNEFSIVHVDGKENVFFKALKTPVTTGTKPITIETGGTFKYNKDSWEFVDLDSPDIVKKKRWEPYNIYGTSDVVYVDKTILPYLNYNEGSALSDIDDITYLLPSSYPFKLYEDDNLNFAYYQSTRNFNIAQGDPRFQKYYSVVDNVKNFFQGNTNTGNASQPVITSTDSQGLGYMCKINNNLSLTKEEWSSNPYQGCSEPYSIYTNNNGILTFSIPGIIKGNFLPQLTIGGAQNWSVDELEPFYTGVGLQLNQIVFPNKLPTIIRVDSTLLPTGASENYFNIEPLDNETKCYFEINEEQYKISSVSQFEVVQPDYQTFVINNVGTVQNPLYLFTYYPDPTSEDSNLYFVYNNGVTLSQSGATVEAFGLIDVDIFGAITEVTILDSNAGKGYIAGTVTLTQTGVASANEATVTIEIDTSIDTSSSPSVTSGGKNYAPGTVTLSQSGVSATNEATGSVIVNSKGEVQTLTITTGGSGYISGTVTLTQSGVTDEATATISIVGSVLAKTYTVTNNGSGYTTGKIAAYNLQNQTINKNRVVACCKKNTVLWDDYTLPQELYGSSNSFAYNSIEMLDNFKSNTSNNAFITQSDGLSNIEITPDKITLYYSTQPPLITSKIPTTAKTYSTIIQPQYYVEIFENSDNVYYTVRLTSNTIYFIPKTFEQYPGITFFLSSSSSSPTKPSVTSFDTVYYSKLSYPINGVANYPFYLYSGDTRQGTQFSNTSSCIYFDDDLTVRPDTYGAFQSLLGNYLIAKYETTNLDSPNFLLTLQNSPCELGNTTDWCSDCNAQSSADVSSQAVAFIPLEKGTDGTTTDPSLMNKPLCRNKPEFIINDSKFDFANALFLYLVPLPVEYQPPDFKIDNIDTMYCRIMTYFGSQFMGWLKFNRSIEINKDHEIRPLETTEPILSTTPAFVSYSNFDILNTQKETTVLIGDQFVQARLEEEVTEKQIYYTDNFKDEDIFKITYSGEKYDIKKMENGDIFFYVEKVITDDLSPYYFPGEVADFALAGSYFDLSSYTGETLSDGESYLINMSPSTLQNGVYLYSATDQTLTRHEDFNTYEKLRKNNQVGTSTSDLYYFDISLTDKESINKGNSDPKITKVSTSGSNNYITRTTGVTYYDDSNLPTTTITATNYIINSITDISKNGYYESGTTPVSLSKTNRVFQSSNGVFENMYWSWNINTTNNTYTFTNITNLYNEVSALTNRSNKLMVSKLSGVEKFTKDKTFAKGMPLTNLNLYKAFKPSSLVNPTEINTFSEIRENRKPLQLMTSINNDCSLFFDFNPFINTTILRSYNLVENTSKVPVVPILQNVLGLVGQLFDPDTSVYDNTNNEKIDTNLVFGFKYQFNQYVASMDQVPVFRVLTSTNSSMLVSYFINEQQVGQTEILSSVTKITVSGKSPAATEYQSKLPGQAQIVIELRSGYDSTTTASDSPSLTFEMIYDNLKVTGEDGLPLTFTAPTATES